MSCVLHKLRFALPFFIFTISAFAQNSWIFSAPRDYPVGISPDSVVVQDFNGDGHPDIATANQKSNNVSILLQNADSSFENAVNYAVGNGPVSLQAGDVNNDGKLDLLVLNATDHTLGVLLGNGDGTFQAQKLTTISGGPIALAVGDFNGDGKLDAAVAVPLPQVGNYAVAVLLGNGDGTFQAGIAYPVSSQPYALVAADFNNDGSLDLVIAGGGSVSVLLGKGDGTFQASVNTSGTINAITIVVADFNLDGKLDLVSGNPGEASAAMYLLLGNGDGTFSVQTLSQAGVPIAAGDLNGDSKPDLITFSPQGPIQILVGNGEGSFAAGQTLVGAQDGSDSAVLVDINGDQKLDLILAQATGYPFTNSVMVVHGNGDGTLATPPIYGQIPSITGSYPTVVSLVAADFNKDGKADLAAGIAYSSALGVFTEQTEAIYLNDGQGFSSPATTKLTVSNSVSTSTAAADFNSDGYADLAVASAGIGILLGTGTGTFQPQIGYGSGMDQPIAVSDLNHDGKLDIIGGDGIQIAALLGNGDGTFGFPLLSSTLNQAMIGVAVADFNHDGNLDVAALTAPAGCSPPVQVLMGVGDGTFSLGPSYALGSYIVAVATGDINGDGIPDIVASGSDAGCGQPSEILVLLGVGDGTFQNPISTPILSGPVALAIADLNLDGKADVVVGNSFDASVLLGNGDGTFQIPMQFYVNGSGPLVVADLNGDGRPDIAVADKNGIRMLLNVSGLTSPWTLLSPSTVQFASGLVGSKSAAQAVTLTNNGPGALTVGSIAIGGPQASDFQQTNTCGASLAPGLICTINVSFSPQAGGVRTAILTVTGNSSNLPQSVNLSGTAQSFSIGAGSSTQTISAGQTATFDLTVSPNGGFNQAVAMSCSGAPASSTCSVSPNSFTLNGQATQAVTVTVGTTKESARLLPPNLGSGSNNYFDSYWLFLGSLGLVVFVGLTRSSHRRRYSLASAALLGVAITLASCGSSSKGGGGGTQSGTYNLTVTGNFTSGSTTLTQSVKLTLVVQ